MIYIFEYSAYVISWDITDIALCDSYSFSCQNTFLYFTSDRQKKTKTLLLLTYFDNCWLAYVFHYQTDPVNHLCL